MKMRLHILKIGLMAALAVALVVPAHSLADYYVPPENSAANQYTESFPGAGGEKDGKRKSVTPADTLGASNAKRLEKHSPAGKAAAEVAAETAPAPVAADGGAGDSSEDTGGGAGGTGNAGGGSGKGTGGPSSGTTSGANGGSTSSGGGNTAVSQSAKVDQPEGSSGLSQVLGQATGVGDGNVGLWLPLVILLTLAGSIAYAARSRRLRHGRSA
jgi:hypothetical protein